MPTTIWPEKTDDYFSCPLLEPLGIYVLAVIIILFGGVKDLSKHERLQGIKYQMRIHVMGLTLMAYRTNFHENKKKFVNCHIF